MNIGQFVHLSVDDVIWSFQWIYENQPQSIFNEPMLKKLKEWHETYNLSCDLYVFEECPNFRLEWLQDCYWEEIKKESYWLRMAWHQEKAQEYNSEENSLASLERTYQLITKKAGEAAWANVVRLHMWAGTEKLIKELKKKNVEVLLTSNIDKQSYCLTEEEMAEIAEKGSIEKEGVCYKKTAIRFDVMADEITVEELYQITQSYIRQIILMRSVEMFFHEWQFEKISSKMDEYWEGFEKLRLPLLIDTGVVVSNKLYFTTSNTNYLYVMNLDNYEISKEKELPPMKYLAKNYASLHYFAGMIWLIPCWADEILVYNICKKDILCYSLSFLKEESKEMMKIKTTIQEENYLWVLPAHTECLVRIDMKCCTFSVIADWSNLHLKRENSSPYNFKDMIKQGNKFYLLCNNTYSNHLIIDSISGACEVWNKNLSVGFGMSVNEKELLYTAISDFSDVQCIQVETLEKKNLRVAERISQKEYADYPFWFFKKFQNRICLLPYEAKEVVIYDINTEEISVIPYEIPGYFTMSGKPYYAAIDAISYNDKVIVLPYKGDCIGVISKRNEVSFVKCFDNVKNLLRNYSYEIAGSRLEEYLDYVKGYDVTKCSWKHEEKKLTTGLKIFKYN